MALTHSTAARNAALDAVVDLLDAGAGAGNLVIMTGGDVEVATCPLSDPAFAAATGGTVTADAITSDTSATGGTAALFKMEDSNNLEVFRGTVGTSGSDLNISSTVIGAGDTVDVTSFVLTAFA